MKISFVDLRDGWWCGGVPIASEGKEVAGMFFWP